MDWELTYLHQDYQEHVITVSLDVPVGECALANVRVLPVKTFHKTLDNAALESHWRI